MFLLTIGTFGAWEKGFLVDTRVTRLVERRDADLLIGVFFDDTESILVSIKGSHEYEGNIDTVGGVEMLDLTDSEIEEGHIVLYL